MRNTAIIIILLLSVSCSKQVLNSNSENYNGKLNGKWNWVSSTGGFAGHTITPATENYRAAIKFNKDSVYFFRNDTVPNKDKFTISKGTSIFSPDSALIIQYHAGHVNQVIRSVKNDTLTLADNVYDGYASVYVKDK